MTPGAQGRIVLDYGDLDIEEITKKPTPTQTPPRVQTAPPPAPRTNPFEKTAVVKEEEPASDDICMGDDGLWDGRYWRTGENAGQKRAHDEMDVDYDEQEQGTERSSKRVRTD